VRKGGGSEGALGAQKPQKARDLKPETDHCIGRSSNGYCDVEV